MAEQISIIKYYSYGSRKLGDSLYYAEPIECSSWKFWKAGKFLLYMKQNQSELFTWLSKVLESWEIPLYYEMIVSVILHFLIKYLWMCKVSWSFSVLHNAIISPTQPVKCVLFQPESPVSQWSEPLTFPVVNVISFSPLDQQLLRFSLLLDHVTEIKCHLFRSVQFDFDGGISDLVLVLNYYHHLLLLGKNHHVLLKLINLDH